MRAYRIDDSDKTEGSVREYRIDRDAVRVYRLIDKRRGIRERAPDCQQIRINQDS